MSGADDADATLVVRPTPTPASPPAQRPDKARSEAAQPPAEPPPSILDLALEATVSGRPAPAGVPAPPAAEAPPPPPLAVPIVAPGDPPPSPVLRPMAPVERLAREPTRFAFDQALDIAAQVAPGALGDPLALRFRSVPRLAHPAGEVVQAKPDQGELTVATYGLVGTGGVLPRHLTATVGAELRKRSTALHAFLDLQSRRFVALHAKAGAKYRPTRNPEPAARVLAAAIGMGTPGLDERLAPPQATLLFHAGNLAARSRSAERLRAMLEEETGGRVDIDEFAGGWVRLPEGEQTRFGGGRLGQHAALGRGAAAGSQVWDSQARFVIRIGPLPRRAFEDLLPGTPRHRRLVDLARLFAGLDTGFALNLILARDEIPPLALGGTARLGQTSWLGSPDPRTRDGAEPMFDPR